MTRNIAHGEPLAVSLSIIANRLTASKMDQQQVISVVAGRSDIWVEREPLLEVALRLLAQHQIAPGTLTGARLAALTRRLIRDEMSPGGPYKAGPYDMRLTNFAVHKLLNALNISLGSLDSYLLESTASNLNSFENEVLEVLQHTPGNLDKASPLTGESVVIAEEVFVHTKSYLKGINSTIDSLLDRMIEKVKSVDGNGEVSCLAFDFYHSLAKKPLRFNRQALIDIGVANYCAWIAYAIYDDFIDGEGKAELLPIANIAHRRSIIKYQQVAEDLGISPEEVIHSFDSVDIGSSIELWEFKANIVDPNNIEISALPDYSNYDFLSERALGFLAGPLLILSALDRVGSEKKSLMKKGLSAFIQARQISDDLTDWPSDLYSGNMTSVVTRLLADAHIQSSIYDIQDLARKLSAQLWKSSFLGITYTIKSKLDDAELQISSSGIFAKNAPFYDHYFEPIRKVTIDLEDDYQIKTSFLKAYKD